MNNCPCCSHRLLQHIGRQGLYWFCLSCNQEMPNLAKSVKASTLLHSHLSTKPKHSPAFGAIV